MICTDLRMSCENCSIFNCQSSRKVAGILFLGIPTNHDDYSTNCKNNIVAVITCEKVMDYKLRRHSKNKELHTSSLFLLN